MDTAKIPLDMPKPTPMFSTEPHLTSLVDSAVPGLGKYDKCSATITKSTGPRFDGTSDPGSPGEPV